MFGLSICIENSKDYPSKKSLLLETNKFLYGIDNRNIFKGFDSKKEKCPVWLKDVYRIKKLGNWFFWRGRK